MCSSIQNKLVRLLFVKEAIPPIPEWNDIHYFRPKWSKSTPADMSVYKLSGSSGRSLPRLK